jgi:phytoene/squalene synthetase
MRTEYLTAIAVASLAAIAGSAVYFVRTADYCPQPSASSVAALFAPCQAFDTAMGHALTKQEAVRMGFLAPTDQRSSPPAQQRAPTPAQLVAQDFQSVAQERATVGVAGSKGEH